VATGSIKAKLAAIQHGIMKYNGFIDIRIACKISIVKIKIIVLKKFTTLKYMLLLLIVKNLSIQINQSLTVHVSLADLKK